MFKSLMLAAATTAALAIGSFATPSSAEAGGWRYHGGRHVHAYGPSYRSVHYGYYGPRAYSTYYHPQNSYYYARPAGYSYYRGGGYYGRGGGFSISIGF